MEFSGRKRPHPGRCQRPDDNQVFPDSLAISGPNRPRIILGGFLLQADHRVLSLSAYAYQKAISLVLAYLSDGLPYNL